jgi:gas vesicle protein
MANMLNDTIDNAKTAVETAKEGTEHAYLKTRDRLVEGFKAITEVIHMIRNLDRDDALGWVGLARRKGPFESIALFGAGIVVGAGAAMLLAPMSGSDLRRNLFGKVQAQAKDVADKVEASAKQVEEKGEELAHQAADNLKKAEKKVETKVMAGVDAVKDAEKKVENKVMAGADALKDAMKSGVDTVKQAADNTTNNLTASSNGNNATNGTSNGNGSQAKQGQQNNPHHRVS